MALKVVIFDLDGTLTDSMPDLAAAKKALGLDANRPILESISLLPPDEQAKAQAYLDEFEWESARAACLIDGATEIISMLDAANVRTALLTRSHTRRAQFIIDKCGIGIELVIGRDDAEPKPSAEGVHMALAHFEASPDDALVVGDYKFDIEAGRAAGVATIAITDDQSKPWADLATHQVETLRDCIEIIRQLITPPGSA
jgi:HAD superfamily hydrolase (TIGR01509 family)